ncbi:hypothetical protein AVEN_47139-1 [Araneus ventricosus]|uniref:Uncharacterized protein n=1 Tax=Araneus ventricosus TaxID=182803 RepID=A0A4Y2ASA5_ARAVE|nr:hypothetical protein AVEN_47139-1 [Araneus ventricosus]
MSADGQCEGTEKEIAQLVNSNRDKLEEQPSKAVDNAKFGNSSCNCLPCTANGVAKGRQKVRHFEKSGKTRHAGKKFYNQEE